MSALNEGHANHRSDKTWEAILDHGEFDYVVIGSGCTALAFIDEALRLNPKTKILCLERGGTSSVLNVHLKG